MPKLQALIRGLTALACTVGMLVSLPALGQTITTSTCVAESFSVASLGNGNLSVTCTTPGSTTPPPTTCTITASQNPLTSGTTPNVTATLIPTSACGTITGWSAAANGTGTPVTGATSTLTLPAVASGSPAIAYLVTVSVSGGTASPTAPTSVTVNPPGSTPPTGTISCGGGYATQLIDIPWGAVGRGEVDATTSGFTNNMIVVVRFTTPNVTLTTMPTSGVYAQTAGGALATAQTLGLSATPCDFSAPNSLGQFTASFPQNGGGGSIPYQAGGSSAAGLAVLQPNTTYYFNLKNEKLKNGVPTGTCGPSGSTSTSCNFKIGLKKPPGW